MDNISTVLDRVTKERDLYLKRGLELASYPTQSPVVKEVFTAFAQAQAKFPSIAKEKQGYGYKYAELSSVLSSTLPILAEFELHFTQYTTRKNILHTRIGHSSGEYFESQYEMPFPTPEEFSAKNTKKTSYMQELGTIRTYTRRYEALALLGLQPDDDTDRV